MENIYTEEELKQAKLYVTGMIGRHHQNKAKARKVLAYCSRHKLKLEDVLIERHNDYGWRCRRNRTENQRKAEIVGTLGTAMYGRPIIWVMPKEGI